jgi:hypothetical protein
MIRMFSVTTSEVGKRTILTIDGQLSGDYIEVVEICCNQAESEGKPIDVFLHNASTIDESGRALLARLAAKGVRLLAAGMWTPYVVRDLAAASSEALTSPRGQPALVAREQSPKSERGHG